MDKQININSKEWCNFIFEGKNKKYGAYHLRQGSSCLYIWGFIIMLLFCTVSTIILSEIIRYNQSIDDNCGLGPECHWEELILPELPAPPIIAPTLYKFVAPTIEQDGHVIKMLGSKKEDGILNEEGEFDKKTTFEITPIVDINFTDEFEEELNPRIECKFPIDTIATLDTPPLFPGGDIELNKYLKKHIRYPIASIENSIEGNTIAQFTVNTKGEIQDIEILKSLNHFCDKEIMKALHKMPKWIPAKVNGTPINTRLILPVIFDL